MLWRSRLHPLMTLVGSVLAAQEPDRLEDLLNVKVISASRQARRPSDSPAVMAVITRSEIRRLGYRSVAEALAQVPGLHGLDDHLRVDVGVRGVRGGLRATNRILKVMVDEQPIAFRPDGSVSLGPELVPMEAVERIEVLRGPASALYGADAFLGVVHIITRRAGSEGSALVSANLQRERGRAAGGGEALVQGTLGSVGLLAAVAYGERDRSNHPIPPSSPLLASGTPAGRESRGAWNYPSTLLLKARKTSDPTWIHEASLHLTRTSAVADWMDIGPLSHANHVALRTLTARLQSAWKPSPSLHLRGSLAAGDSRPDGERLSTGSSVVYPRRDFSCRSLDLALEGQWEWRSDGWLIGGLDQTRDRHQLMDLYSVSAATGVEQRVFPPQGTRTLQNLGLYLQTGFRPSLRTEMTLNLRRDDHSVFGPEHTWRASLVARPRNDIHAKLILGTSYKAPSPLQLYAQPIYPGDLVGNAALHPEHAFTVEASLGIEGSSGNRASLTAFHTRIRNLIELAPYNTNQRPVNRDRVNSTGLEGEARWIGETMEWAFTFAAVRAEQLRREPLKPEAWLPTATFPRHSGSLRATRFLPWGGNLDIILHHASARRSSESNTFEHYFRPYALPPVTTVDIGCLVPLEAWRIRLRVLNVLDRISAEPGARGYDLPGLRREWVLSLLRRF